MEHQTIALCLIGQSSLLRTNRASRQHFVSMVTHVIRQQEATALKGGGCF